MQAMPQLTDGHLGRAHAVETAYGLTVGPILNTGMRLLTGASDLRRWLSGARPAVDAGPRPGGDS